MEFLTWQTKDIVYKRDSILLGIDRLNNLCNDKFLKKIKSYIIVIFGIKDRYYQYDIDNTILSRMQNNKLLNKDKYRALSRFREAMWKYDILTISDIDLIIDESII